MVDSTSAYETAFNAHDPLHPRLVLRWKIISSTCQRVMRSSLEADRTRSLAQTWRKIQAMEVALTHEYQNAITYLLVNDAGHA